MGTRETSLLPNGYPCKLRNPRQLLMEELNQFLNSVEASARKILKQQNKKQQQLAVRDRAALARGSSHVSAATSAVLPPHVPSRDELRATYAAGGGPAVSVPSAGNQQLSKPPRSPSRSEHSSETVDDPQSLPRLPPPRSPVTSVPPGSLYAPLQLPSLARKRKSPASALKLLESPLYKSLAKSRSDSGVGSAPGNPQTLKKTLQDVDNVALLLRKMGLHDVGGARSPAHRPDHAVEKRMCNACWAQPDKLTGCERHPRVLGPHGGDALTRITNLELQGPTSWLSDDLYVKYRSESDREALWLAYLALKTQQQEAAESSSSSLSSKKQLNLAVIPIVTRHPVCALFTTLLELENLRTQAETRKRNLAKTFVFDVNLIWLANLDHFNQRQPLHDPGDGQMDPEDPEDHSLRGRRDNEAIREGFSQIQSISTARALQLTVSIGGGPPQLQTQLSSLGGDLSGVRRRKTVLREGDGSFRPLSLLVSGRWDPERRPNVLDRVPGAALVGHAPVLWWRYEPDHELGEEETPEYTKAVALFGRNRTLSSSNGFLVSLVLALDTPVLSPLWFAWQVGSKMPPPELEAAAHALFEADIGFGRVLARVSPCLGSLLSSPLICILDELLPGTVALLNDVAQSDDHWLELPAAVEGHRRGWSEFSDRHLFRQWLLLPPDRSMTPRYDVDAQHCSVALAHANAPGVCGRYCWHETEPEGKQLCRRRVEKDLVYMLQNLLTSGPNGPTYFSVSLAHEVLKDVQGARLATYLALMAEREARAAYEKKLLEIEQKLEAGRLALEAKRQEQQRLEQELQATAAQAELRRVGGSGRNDEVLAEEWTQRLEASVLLEQRGLWQLRELTTDSSGVVFYYSENPELADSHRFLWESPEEWRRGASGDEDEDVEQLSTARSAGSVTSSATPSTKSPLAANAEAQAELAHNLLEDEQFLQRLKAKLGLPTSSRPPTRATTGRGSDQWVLQDEDDAGRCDRLEEMAVLAEEGADPTKAALLATRMARLKLPQAASRRGEGWKRLKTSRLPANFARRAYRTHTEGPRAPYLNQANVATPVGLLDPTDCSPYEPPDFIPELRAHFVPNPAADLQEKQVAVGVREDLSGPAGLQDEGLKPPKESKEQREGRALLCARNNNLEGLELALDEGVDVNARDNHGNTLFILACQQGNKRLAKLLLRRQADMNLQNLSGNTALHYLYEYRHVALAEYLKAKGAQDATPNSAGLTCYEGLSQDPAAQL
ncbi:hypothetical protein BBJ28_00012051 [Nothophytophthora sp. Chile5]|nr:hypothetical protein BBJ28_00012051 [Nothophytophthora sp. Chile5]